MSATDQILPCKHEKTVVDQVAPTIDLLTNLDTLHPDVLLQHAIQPIDYKNGLVFRSAIESIRGTFIASSTTSREGLVQDVLENLKQRARIADFRHRSMRARYDFEVVVQRSPDYFAAIEVKGGEGNSINISERPLWAKEFGVWCHLDGALGKPACSWGTFNHQPFNERNGVAGEIGGCRVLQRCSLWNTHKTMSKISGERRENGLFDGPRCVSLSASYTDFRES